MSFEEARKRYAEPGVNAEEAIRILKDIPVSLHCWQGDDVRGFDTDPSKPLTGGIQTTGNYPGRARTPEELMDDLNILKSIKPQLDELTRQKKEIEDRVKTFMADADTLCMAGTKEQNPIVIATWKTAKDSMKFNEKQFAAEHPELYADYLRTVAGSRRFLIK